MFLFRALSMGPGGAVDVLALPGARGVVTVLRTLTVTKYSPQMEPKETETRSVPFLTGLQKCE